MYNNILLAVDGSKNSFRAAEEAIKIASLVKDCTIEVVAVVKFSDSKSEVLHAKGKEELELSRRLKISPIEEMLKSSNISYEIKMLHGDPGVTIVDYVNKGKYDLVIIGSRGHNLLQEMVLGSVSHKVIKRVNCPVLIVK